MSEALINYEISPTYFRDQPAYFQLIPEHRLFFRELMDLMWLSEGRYCMPFDPSDLAERMGLTEDQVDEAVEALSSDSCGLIDQVFDLEGSLGLKLHCPYLESTYHRMIARIDRERSKDLESDIRKSGRVTPIQQVIRRDDDMEPTIGYMTSEEIASESDFYTNWLPTARFLSCGEVFYIRRLMLKTLSDRFPGRDFTADFESMFHYLMDNSDRRPHHPNMARFVARWLTRNQSSVPASQSSDSTAGNTESGSLEAAFEALLEESING